MFTISICNSLKSPFAPHSAEGLLFGGKQRHSWVTEKAIPPETLKVMSAYVADIFS